MIDAFKEMLDMIKHAPEYTMWVLLGILFYKIFIAGSWMMVARLAIVKIHDYFKTPPTKKVEYHFNGHFIDETTRNSFEALISRIKSHKKELDSDSGFYNSSYIHSSDIAYLNQALSAQIKSDNEAYKAKQRQKAESSVKGASPV